MRFSDEILMAYAEGELAEPQRSEVERAVRADPALAAIVERHRAWRLEVVTADGGAAGEPGTAAAGAAATKVLSLEAARHARSRPAPASPATAAPAGALAAWPRWTALTGTLVAGVLAGSLWFGGADGNSGFITADIGGRLVARGQLDGALSRQLASDPAPNSPARIGTSFVTRDGGYCRSFRMGASAGLACRSGDSWRIPVLSEALRARGAMPEAVLDAIADRILGAPMNGAAERAARERGWKR
jgi:hypothetical protein